MDIVKVLALENSLLNADSDYGLSKIKAEEVHIKWFEKIKIEI